MNGFGGDGLVKSPHHPAGFWLVVGGMHWESVGTLGRDNPDFKLPERGSILNSLLTVEEVKMLICSS